MSATIPFTKMHGLGNDYVYINCFDHPIEQPEKLAPLVSDRHFGIGADGLVLIEADKECDARMRMFNADGSEAQMCGNAIRCVARYCYERKIIEKETLAIATGAGPLNLVLSVNDAGTVDSVTVNMGTPRFEQLPLHNHTGEFILSPLSVDGTDIVLSCVSMGNPHAVIFVDEITDEHVLQLGPKIERHPFFPERVNVEFVKVNSPSEVTMRVWERGSGETLACGTGAAAVTAICVKTAKTERNVTVHLRGGDLHFAYDEAGPMHMTGPATFVFDGLLFGSEESLIRNHQSNV